MLGAHIQLIIYDDPQAPFRVTASQDRVPHPVSVTYILCSYMCNFTFCNIKSHIGCLHTVYQLILYQ